ncbi:DUF4386 domain-containing protein [Devosia sp. PTR5]|uniref:DUF4386 domain-containing protein n=1 Tax=Devosia oryzisoli TaxID=2774138 RepID=A0A927FTH9_9HYPH|nr:DUF4386 domain-containing protein [Devosia oryzisoli]MBD8065995.1 DUF4386 domain-containing protein [Devosia oryzisoli]
MNTIASTYSYAAGAAAGPADPTRAAEKDTQKLARLTGLFFLLTYATSIRPVLTLYVPALSDPAFILGGARDLGLTWGAILEILLILFNIASAVAIYPVLKRRFPVLSLAFVSARIMESAFIAMGIVAVLALGTLRQQAGDADPAALTVVGQALVAIHDWTFKMGPGVVVGFGNGIILGYMMWKTRLLPRFVSILGLSGGPALLAGSAGVMLGYLEFGSTIHGLTVAPEFLWELTLGLWLLVRGFTPSAVTALERSSAACTAQ